MSRRKKNDRYVKVIIYFNKQNIPKEFDDSQTAWDYGKVLLKGSGCEFNGIEDIEKLIIKILKDNNVRLIKSMPVVIDGHKSEGNI